MLFAHVNTVTVYYRGCGRQLVITDVCVHYVALEQLFKTHQELLISFKSIFCSLLACTHIFQLTLHTMTLALVFTQSSVLNSSLKNLAECSLIRPSAEELWLSVAICRKNMLITPCRTLPAPEDVHSE